ncbi:MAG: polymer-forming cytoskeletal protein [Pseudomonadota bacterium]
MIGKSIQVEGAVRGEEDLMIQGEVRGTVELKSNRVTIGSDGRVFADVHAQVICIEGLVDGSLVASEQVVILETAQVTGSITAPRISLKDGARFNGTIDMDPSAEKLNSVFGKRAAATPIKPASESVRSDTGSTN